MQRNDNISELKLEVLSAIYRIIGRALHLEHTVEDIVGILSSSLRTRAAEVILRSREKTHFISSPANHDDAGLSVEIHNLHKTRLGIIFQLAQPFALLHLKAKPFFLDRKTLHSVQKNQVRLFGAPITLGNTLIGVITVDRIFDERVPFEEDVGFLMLISDIIAQIASLDQHAGRKEELLVQENMALRAKISREHLGSVCMGHSPAMHQLVETIRKVANSTAPILLWGESGTGKTYISRIIHELGPRAANPFVIVHCSLPEDLLEQELFGAFPLPGAPAASPCLLEKAAGGTLYLDEVGDLTMPHQIRLLEILDQSESNNFGIGKAKGTDVRLIGSTGRDLFEAAASGFFRKDLLHRLNALPVRVPSVRERKDDIPYLIDFFLNRACKEYGHELRITSQALDRLAEYDWPGNLHEMKNSIIRLVVMAAGSEIRVEDLPIVFNPAFGSGSEAPVQPTLSRLDEMERKEVSAALERNKWIQRKAASELGLTFRQLNYRVKKFGLERMIHENRKVRTRR